MCPHARPAECFTDEKIGGSAGSLVLTEPYLYLGALSNAGGVVQSWPDVGPVAHSRDALEHGGGSLSAARLPASSLCEGPGL